MTEGLEVFVFDVRNPDRFRPSRGVIHEVHPKQEDEDFTRVTGSVALRLAEMHSMGGRTHKPFQKIPVVLTFSISDPVTTLWPHGGTFVALKLGGEA